MQYRLPVIPVITYRGFAVLCYYYQVIKVSQAYSLSSTLLDEGPFPSFITKGDVAIELKKALGVKKSAHFCTFTENMRWFWCQMQKIGQKKRLTIERWMEWTYILLLFQCFYSNFEWNPADFNLQVYFMLIWNFKALRGSKYVGVWIVNPLSYERAKSFMFDNFSILFNRNCVNSLYLTVLGHFEQNSFGYKSNLLNKYWSLTSLITKSFLTVRIS